MKPVDMLNSDLGAELVLREQAVMKHIDAQSTSQMREQCRCLLQTIASWERKTPKEMEMHVVCRSW